MFTGSITALATPFDAADEIDFSALESLVAHQLDNGTSALVVAGTTGESAALRAGEFDRLLQAVTGQVAGQIPVIAGTGSASTDRTLEQTRRAASLRADAVLVVTPYYVRPPQTGLIAHFRAVADVSELPVILYNVPSRTSVDMLPETVAELAGHDRIVAVKEAVGSMERVDALREQCTADFVVLSGDDPTCFEAMRHGARGVISVASNVAPGLISELAAAAQGGDWAVAEECDARLRPLYDGLAVETNPIPVKWALQEMGLCDARLRLPLIALSQEHRSAMREALASLNLLRT
ncbi:4-hydroxy-tetrahydrodipicolinate synthase [Elongatibacter sediminis]